MNDVVADGSPTTVFLTVWLRGTAEVVLLTRVEHGNATATVHAGMQRRAERTLSKSMVV